MLYPLSYERKANRPESVPTELLRGTPLMTVRAADETLVNLGLDSTPRNSAPEQNRDFCGLQRRIGVVELQDDRILLLAVDARVDPQEFEQPTPNIGPFGQIPRVRLARVVGRVLKVVLAQIQCLFGDNESAIAVLPELLSVPAGLTVANVKLDPGWDPLRKDPRLRQIVASLAPKG